MNNFNIGDIIEYCGSAFKGESFREQQVIDIIFPNTYVTMFLDTNEMNSFFSGTQYNSNCILIRGDISEYENGLPLVWEDVV